jgi:hypothetical protein
MMYRKKEREKERKKERKKEAIIGKTRENCSD